MTMLVATIQSCHFAEIVSEDCAARKIKSTQRIIEEKKNADR